VIRALPLALVLLASLVFPATAGTGNPWLDKRTFINMAHQGGEDEFPSNTMYAFREALAAGADTLELDVNRTEDDQLVVMHDWTVDRTTNGTGYTTGLTLAEIQALDAAYNFIPGRNAVAGEPESEYPFRGVRTGEKAPPDGFTAEDFRVPTLAEVMEAFPDTPINIEIKGQEDEESEFLRNAELLAELLSGTDRRDLIVVSFNQAAVDRFHELAPEIDIAPGAEGLVGYFLNGEPMPNADALVAIQVPTTFGDLEVLTPERVVQAHRQGWAVHIWLSGNEENKRVYIDILDHCVDGIMPARPTALERVLRKRDVVRPGGEGLDPCRVEPDLRNTGVASDRVAEIGVKRLGKEPVKYEGRVELRKRGGKLLGRGPFDMPNGARGTTAILNMTKAGNRAFVTRQRVRTVITVRTKDTRGEPARRKVTLRRER
jgi:glycerophosphoryl diester phosphodiesterase